MNNVKSTLFEKLFLFSMTDERVLCYENFICNFVHYITTPFLLVMLDWYISPDKCHFCPLPTICVTIINFPGFLIKNILNSCPTQGRVEGWDAMKPLYYRSVSSKGTGRPRLMHHHKGWWNETKWMRWGWRNGGMKFVAGENGRNPEKNLPRPRFVHHETHMQWPRRELGTPAVEGERLTACATRPPQVFLLFSKSKKNF